MKQYWILGLLLLSLWTSCKKEQQEIVIEHPSVDIGAYSLAAWLSGTGSRTIVFESGLGDGGEPWLQTPFFKKLAKENEVIAYSRAGYGESEEAHNVRDLPQLAADLHALILAAAQNEKVILVGHSLGGAIIRFYAHQYPERVAALLFIDSTHEGYNTPSLDDESQLKQLFSNAGLKGAVGEADQLMEDIELLEGLGPLPDIPVIAISSIQQTGEQDEADRQQWATAHAQLGQGLSNFQHILTSKSGHYVHLEEPDLVLEAIQDLINN